MTAYQVHCYQKIEKASVWQHLELPLDLYDLAHAAISETLHTGGPISSFANQLAALLTEGQDLIWKGNGPGVGRELRRSYSNIHGRFFARAYLEKYERVRHLIPIEGNQFNFANLQVRLRVGQKGDMPDWIGLDSSGLVVAEAKGAHAKSSWLKSLHGGTLPQCLQKAQEQVKRVQIDQSRIAVDLKFKGWSVASRWATEKNGFDPLLAAILTRSGSQTLTEDARRNMTLALQRATFSHIVRGLGYSDENPIGTNGYSAADSPVVFDARRDAWQRVNIEEGPPINGLSAVLYNEVFVPVKSNDELGFFRNRGVRGGQVWLVTALDNALNAAETNQVPEEQEPRRSPGHLSRNGLAITKVESAMITN